MTYSIKTAKTCSTQKCSTFSTNLFSSSSHSNDEGDAIEVIDLTADTDDEEDDVVQGYANGFDSESEQEDSESEQEDSESEQEDSFDDDSDMEDMLLGRLRFWRDWELFSPPNRSTLSDRYRTNIICTMREREHFLFSESGLNGYRKPSLSFEEASLAFGPAPLGITLSHDEDCKKQAFNSVAQAEFNANYRSKKRRFDDDDDDSDSDSAYEHLRRAYKRPRFH